MANEFIIRKGFKSLTDSEITGSLNVTAGITGSLFGTASYALTASYVTNASSFPYTGSAIITGSLIVTGSIISTLGFTGSLSGTASYANNALSASYALISISSSYAITSSLPLLGIITASANNTVITFTRGNGTTFDINIAQSGSVATASYALFAETSNTASYALNGGVTSIIAGSGIVLPTGGTGNVTVVASGTAIIISGSSVTSSFTNSNTWTFNHNLGTRTPIITVFDSSYNQIIPQNIQLVDTASATITFPTLESGFAIASTGGTTSSLAVSSSYSLFSTYASTASFFTETDPIFVSKQASLATTGSNNFKGNQTITGSLTVSSSNTITVIGPMVITGSLLVSGSTTQTGNNNLIGNTTLSGSISVSGSQTLSGNLGLTGSFAVSGSTLQTGNNTLIGNTVLSGSLVVSGSQTFRGVNTLVGNTTISGSFTVSGSVTNQLIGTTNITGSLNVVGDLNVISGSGFYRWGNKLFNYAQFAETASLPLTQNVSGSFILPTTYFAEGISIVSSSRITFANTGIYNIQFSAVVNQGSGKPNFSIWFKETGSNIANSNTIATLEANSQALLAWNFMYPFNSGSYVEMWYNTTGANTVLTGDPGVSGQPSSPALILTVTQIA